MQTQGVNDMEKTIGSATARRKFGQLLEEVYYKGDKIVVERRGRPMAVLVPLELYENWQQQREQFFTLIEKARERNKEVDPEELEKEIETAIRAVREEKNVQQGEPA
jgi:prevent-host-death family protein